MSQSVRFERGDLVQYYGRFDQYRVPVVEHTDKALLIDVGTWEPLVVSYDPDNHCWYKVGEMENPPKDWRDRWGINKHWFNHNAEPLWREGQRVQYVHDETIYGTVVVTEWNGFGVKADGEDNKPFEELPEDWKRVE